MRQSMRKKMFKQFLLLQIGTMSPLKTHCPGLPGRVTCRDKMMTEGTISIFLRLFRWLIYNTGVVKTAFVAQLWKKKILKEEPDLYICILSPPELETRTLPRVLFLVTRNRSNPKEDVLKIWVWVKQVKSVDPSLNFLW